MAITDQPNWDEFLDGETVIIAWHKDKGYKLAIPEALIQQDDFVILDEIPLIMAMFILVQHSEEFRKDLAEWAIEHQDGMLNYMVGGDNDRSNH